MKRFLTAPLLAIVCVACTSPIGVVRVNASDPMTRTGVAYHLPYTRFNVSVTRMVKACSPASITLATTVEVSTADPAIDRQQAYTIDPNSLAGIFRIGAVKAEYASNGLIKSMNASAEDRTAQVLSAAATGVVKLATLAAAVEATNAPIVPACNQPTLDALEALPQATSNVTQASIELALAAAEYKGIQDRVTALGGVVDESTRRALVVSRSRSDDAAMALTNKKVKLDKIKEVLSHTEKFYWPRSGSEFQTLHAAPDNLINLWRNPGFSGPVRNFVWRGQV